VLLLLQLKRWRTLNIETLVLALAWIIEIGGDEALLSTVEMALLVETKGLIGLRIETWLLHH
jgi:hypothetical protein